MINYGPFESNDTGVFKCLVTMFPKRCKESSRETYEPVGEPQLGTAAEAKQNAGQNPKTYSRQSGRRLTLWSNLLKSLLPEN